MTCGLRLSRMVINADFVRWSVVVYSVLNGYVSTVLHEPCRCASESHGNQKTDPGAGDMAGQLEWVEVSAPLGRQCLQQNGLFFPFVDVAFFRSSGATRIALPHSLESRAGFVRIPFA